MHVFGMNWSPKQDPSHNVRRLARFNVPTLMATIQLLHMYNVVQSQYCTVP